MIFSKKCEYAVRALVHLARSHGVSRAREISNSQKVPYPFMGKILQELRAKGFVQSARGTNGGFALAKPASAVRLIDVLTAVDGDQVLTGCLYGFAGCSGDHPCPLHEGWKEVRSRIEAYLLNHTIADLAKQRPSNLGKITAPGNPEKSLGGPAGTRWNPTA